MTHDGQIVRDEQARDVEVRLNFLQQVDDLSLHGHIERRHRLVAHQDFRIQCERAGDADALALTAGKFMRVALRVLG